jgi:hypothetical protein
MSNAKIVALEKAVKKAGYSFEGDELTGDDGESIVEFEFEEDAVLSHCCGVQEWGGFKLYAYFACTGFPKKGTIEYRAILLTIIRKLLYAKRNELETNQNLSRKRAATKAGVKVARGVIFTTNGRDDNAIIEDALRLIPKEFTAASRTMNPDSGSIITIWVAKF